MAETRLSWEVLQSNCCATDPSGCIRGFGWMVIMGDSSCCQECALACVWLVNPACCSVRWAWFNSSRWTILKFFELAAPPCQWTGTEMNGRTVYSHGAAVVWMPPLAITECLWPVGRLPQTCPPCFSDFILSLYFTVNNLSEPEAASGEEQHPGQAGSACRHSDAWRTCWRQRRNAGDDQGRP